MEIERWRLKDGEIERWKLKDREIERWTLKDCTQQVLTGNDRRWNH